MFSMNPTNYQNFISNQPNSSLFIPAAESSISIMTKTPAAESNSPSSSSYFSDKIDGSSLLSICSTQEIINSSGLQCNLKMCKQDSLNIQEDNSIISEAVENNDDYDDKELQNSIDQKSQLCNVSDETIQAYETLYQNMSEKELLDKYSKLQKSNFLKNILRSFYAFILEEGDEIVIESVVQDASKSISQIRKEFTAFTKQKKHNQSTLVSIMKSKRFSSILYYYLSYYSLDWVRKGSTRNIEMHILCITHLKRCVASTPLINNFKLYKKH